MNDNVLSSNERLITIIGAIVLHLIVAISFYRCNAYEPPVPPPKPAGFTMVSFGRPAEIQQNPTAASPELEEEFVPPVMSQEETVIENTEVATSTSPNVESTTNDNPITTPKTETNATQTTKDTNQKPKEVIKETKEQTKTQQPENKNEEQPKKETSSATTSSNTTSTSQDGQDSTTEKTGNTDDKDQQGQIGEKDGAINSIVGWRWVSPPKAKDVMKEQGKIVFEVSLDENGNVVQVKTIEQSPTITYSTVRAYKVALQSTKFERTIVSPPQGITTGQITFIIRID